MANTGYKQATIAYKVDAATGAPLDINGQRTSESGRKQAIRLLTGYSNPDPSQYEIEAYFSAGATLKGRPTKIYDVFACPTGYIFVTPSDVTLTDAQPSVTLSVNSSLPWSVVLNSAGVTVTPSSGLAGVSVVTLERTGASEADGVVRFSHIAASADVTVLNVAAERWILASGYWDDLGVWMSGETWNF